MSTPNYKNVNASKVFATELEDSTELDDLIKNIQNEIGEAVDINDHDRSYPGNIISEIRKSVGKWGIIFYIIIRSGYYSGVNLDWDCKVLDDIKDMDFDFNDKDLPKTVQNKIESLKVKAEKVFTKFTTPLIRVATFSNGEAVYRKA